MVIYSTLVDNNRVFLESLLQQVQRERVPVQEPLTWEQARRPSKVSVESVSLRNWLNMWARLFVGWEHIGRNTSSKLCFQGLTYGRLPSLGAESTQGPVQCDRGEGGV